MSSPAAPTALRTLARRGAWRAVAEGAAERLRAEGPSPSALAWRALALARLGDAERAADALAAAGVPEGVAAGSAKVELDARAAAELHLVWAELPALDGKRGETVQRLYAQLGDAAAGDTKAAVGGGGGVSVRHERRVLTSLLGHHAAAGQFAAALAVAARLVETVGDDDADDAGNGDGEAAWTLSQAGLACLQLGAMASGRALLARADARAGEDAAGDYLRALHAGLTLCCEQRLADAAAAFARAGEAARRNGAAAVADTAVADNNAAVCQLYANKLPEAVRSLEGCLQQGLQYLRSDLVCNLASCYELESADPGAAKKRLGEWIDSAAPDDFQRAALRM